MTIPVLIILTVTGLVLLKLGAGWFVDGIANLARKYGISPLTIGITIVAFGTSAPELVVNTLAAAGGNHDIITGNIIGSNIFNLFLILSVIGIITPLSLQSDTAWRKIPFSFIIIIILFFLSVSSLINPVSFNRSFNFDITVLAAGTLILLLAMYTGKKRQIDRWEAFILLAGYIAYMIYLLTR
ncbi:MAG: sodium:calcium antiporter [Bacteroidales bacterium]